MKKWFFLTILVVCFVFSGTSIFAAGQAEEGPKALPEKIVVGCIEPFTGSYAVFGTEAKIGMEIAIQHINESGGIVSLGGIPLELVSEDSGESPDTAKLATESIISKHQPVAILGLYISRQTIPASEVTDRNEVILVADALVDSLTAMGRRYVFRPSANAGQYGASAVEFIVDMVKKTGIAMDEVAIISEDSAFGHSVAMGAANAALANGMTIIYQKEYPYDLSDATSIVSDISNFRADVVFHCPYFMDAILFAKAFRESGKTPKFIAGMGACGYVDDNSIEALGDTVNAYTNTYGYNPEMDTPANKKFVKAFRAQTGNLPTDSSGMNYYGMWTLKEALELSGKMFPEDPLNPENLRTAFINLDITTGPAAETYPTQHISFTETGDNPHARAVVMQVINGQPKVVWPFAGAEVEPIFPREDASY